VSSDDRGACRVPFLFTPGSYPKLRFIRLPRSNARLIQSLLAAILAAIGGALTAGGIPGGCGDPRSISYAVLGIGFVLFALVCLVVGQWERRLGCTSDCSGYDPDSFLHPDKRRLN